VRINKKRLKMMKFPSKTIKKQIEKKLRKKLRNENYFFTHSSLPY
jgi:hypothetical protein